MAVEMAPPASAVAPAGAASAEAARLHEEEMARWSRRAVAHLAGGGSAAHSYALTVWRRGVYDLGPLTVHWGDPFGLTRRQAELCEPLPLIVHPAIEPLLDRPLTRMWEDPPIRPPISKP